MRDMSQVLERWAGWARSENNGVYYSPIAAGFKGLLPQCSSVLLSCSDSDGLLIEGCIAKLKIRKPDEYEIILKYYYFGMSKRKIAQMYKCDEKIIRIKMLLAEGFIDGCLAALNAKMDMDAEFV